MIQRLAGGHREGDVQIPALVEQLDVDLFAGGRIDDGGSGDGRREGGDESVGVDQTGNRDAALFARHVGKAARDEAHFVHARDEILGEGVADGGGTGALGGLDPGFTRIEHDRHPLHSPAVERSGNQRIRPGLRAGGERDGHRYVTVDQAHQVKFRLGVQDGGRIEQSARGRLEGHVQGAGGVDDARALGGAFESAAELGGGAVDHEALHEFAVGEAGGIHPGVGGEIHVHRARGEGTVDNEAEGVAAAQADGIVGAREGRAVESGAGGVECDPRKVLAGVDDCVGRRAGAAGAAEGDVDIGRSVQPGGGERGRGNAGQVRRGGGACDGPRVGQEGGGHRSGAEVADDPIVVGVGGACLEHGGLADVETGRSEPRTAQRELGGEIGDGGLDDGLARGRAREGDFQEAAAVQGADINAAAGIRAGQIGDGAFDLQGQRGGRVGFAGENGALGGSVRAVAVGERA